MNRKVEKAVFPVAGFGSRFLPATKASPKEMMPVVDKPLIQYAVEEVIASGVKELIFITGRNKRAIEDHFDKAYELEMELRMRGKGGLLETVEHMLPKDVHCIFIRQPEALGLGHAVLCAEPAVGDAPFVVVLADDLLESKVPFSAQMMDVFHQHQSSVIGVQEVSASETGSYGIVAMGESLSPGLCSISGIVEKPQPELSPSTTAVIGRYIFTPRIFHHLRGLEQQGVEGELQLTDAIAALLREEAVLSQAFSGQRYDCGSKLGYLQATVSLGTKHPQVGEAFSDFLQDFLKNGNASGESAKYAKQA